MDESIQQFVSITGASTERARFFLEAAGGDLQTAMSSFYESEPQSEAGAEAEVETATTNESSAPAIPDTYTGPRTLSGQPVDPSAVSGFGTSSASNRASRPAASGASRGGIATFRDLQSASSRGPSRTAGDDHDDDDDDADDDEMNYFAGGERSALSVENPEARRRRDQAGGDLVQEILRRAEEEGQRHPEELAKLSGSRSSPSSSSLAFTGRGRTINDAAEEPSSSSATTSMPGGFGSRPDADNANDVDDDDGEGEVAIRNLTFWQDGFSIEDGELMRYDDPAHAQTLAAINSGHAPLDLLNIRFGQEVSVHVHRRTDEKYKPPPMKAFGGSGNRLGSPAPASFASASRSQAPAAAAGSGASASASAGSQDFQVDADKPTTQLQVRLGDGQRMAARLNTHHTVADLRSYINAANPGMSTRSYTLNASFPPKPLLDESLTLQEAGLLNAVVIQKFQ